MIPLLSLMVGAYIITKMIRIISGKNYKKESVVSNVFAVITIFVTFFCVLFIFIISNNATSALDFF